MPRPAGSLNAKTLEKMVANGDLCLLSQRATCVKCREARERDNAERVQRQVKEQLDSLPADLKAGGRETVVGATKAIIVETFIEYRAPDGKEWRVERGMDLLRDFEIIPAHVSRYIGLWHAAMAGQDRIWMIVRRLYGVAPMLGISDPDEVRVWPAKELADSLGLTEGQIEATIGETKLFWARYRSANRQDRKAVGMDPKRAMTTEEVDAILDRYEFSTIAGEVERRYVAKRCIDLEAYLEHDTGRPMAKSAIQQELLIFYVLDVRIAQHQATVAAKIKENPKSTNEDNENKRLMDLMEARAKANKSYQETMTVLGATQVQTGSVTKRASFQLCLGAMIEAVQKYMANADNSLVDGFATEGEIILAMREKELRPPQYRPDVAIMWVEAMDRLWDKDFEPTPVGRMRSRKIRACFRSAIKQMMIEEGEGVDAPGDEELLIGGDTQGTVAPVSPVPPGFGDAAPSASPSMAAMPPLRPRGDASEVSVF